MDQGTTVDRWADEGWERGRPIGRDTYLRALRGRGIPSFWAARTVKEA